MCFFGCFKCHKISSAVAEELAKAAKEFKKIILFENNSNALTDDANQLNGVRIELRIFEVWDSLSEEAKKMLLRVDENFMHKLFNQDYSCFHTLISYGLLHVVTKLKEPTKTSFAKKSKHNIDNINRDYSSALNTAIFRLDDCKTTYGKELDLFEKNFTNFPLFLEKLSNSSINDEFFTFLKKEIEEPFWYGDIKPQTDLLSNSAIARRVDIMTLINKFVSNIKSKYNELLSKGNQEVSLENLEKNKIIVETEKHFANGTKCIKDSMNAIKNWFADDEELKPFVQKFEEIEKKKKTEKEAQRQIDKKQSKAQVLTLNVPPIQRIVLRKDSWEFGIDFGTLIFIDSNYDCSENFTLFKNNNPKLSIRTGNSTYFGVKSSVIELKELSSKKDGLQKTFELIKTFTNLSLCEKEIKNFFETTFEIFAKIDHTEFDVLLYDNDWRAYVGCVVDSDTESDEDDTQTEEKKQIPHI